MATDIRIDFKCEVSKVEIMTYLYMMFKGTEINKFNHSSRDWGYWYMNER